MNKEKKFSKQLACDGYHLQQKSAQQKSAQQKSAWQKSAQQKSAQQKSAWQKSKSPHLSTQLQITSATQLVYSALWPKSKLLLRRRSYNGLWLTRRKRVKNHFRLRGRNQNYTGLPCLGDELPPFFPSSLFSICFIGVPLFWRFEFKECSLVTKGGIGSHLKAPITMHHVGGKLLNSRTSQFVISQNKLKWRYGTKMTSWGLIPPHFVQSTLMHGRYIFWTQSIYSTLGTENFRSNAWD